MVLFVVPVWGRGTPSLGLTEGGPAGLGDGRFEVVPVILLGTAVALLLSPVPALTKSQLRRIGIPVFLVQVAVLTVVNFAAFTVRSFDPPWSPKVAAIYAQQCKGVPPSKLVTIPNNVLFGLSKYGLFPVTVPCSSLAP